GAGANARVFAIAERPSGALLIGGNFTSFDGVPAGLLVEQVGSGWVPLFAPPPIAPTGVTAIEPLPGGGIAAVGGAGTFAGSSFGVSDGSSWSFPGPLRQPGGAPAMMLALTRLADGTLVAGGRVQDAGAEPVANIVRFDPTAGTFTALGDGTNARVRALLRTSSGTLYAGGNFTRLDGVPVRSFARHDGASWQPVHPSPAGGVATIAEAVNGDLLVGGSFTAVGNVQANRIARWDGRAWHPLGNGSTLEVRRIVPLPNGDVAAFGSFTGGFSGPTLARWDGAAWQPFGEGDTIAGSGAVITDVDDSLGTLANGDLVALVTTGVPADNPVVRWDGTEWTVFAPGEVNPANDLVVLPDDRLLRGTRYWNGSSWQPSNADHAITAAARPDGRTWLATWDGNGTSHVAAGVPGSWSNLIPGAGLIDALLADDDGGLWVAGQVRDLGGQGGAFLARVETPCPASVSQAGPGCQSSIGPLTQQATRAAWVGGNAVAETSDLPSGSIALHAVGFQQQALPLGNVLAQAAAGCVLWHTADLLVTPLAVPGAIAYVIQVPPSLALAGSDYRTQVVLFELDGAGAIARVATSNALRWVIGSFQ
ncbi:MAG: hypothetical protein KAI24_16400, partial [Planctomycetes bacterium]|nr:hypothetical protein [Planctomycetota bacterium]